MMLGLPKKKTFVEFLLLFVGTAGAALGLFLVFIGIAGFILDQSSRTNGSATGIFFIGAVGVLAGILIMGLSQALSTFRMLAHNTYNQESSR